MLSSKQDNLDERDIHYHLMASSSAIESAAEYNFYDYLSNTAYLVASSIIERRDDKLAHIPLLAMPSDDHLFIRLLDSISSGEMVIPTIYDSSQLADLLILRANEYLPVAISAMADGFYAEKLWMNPDTNDIISEFDLDAPIDEDTKRNISEAVGWKRILKRLSESDRPAALMRDIYDDAGLDSLIQALELGVPLDDLLS